MKQLLWLTRTSILHLFFISIAYRTLAAVACSTTGRCLVQSHLRAVCVAVAARFSLLQDFQAPARMDTLDLVGLRTKFENPNTQAIHLHRQLTPHWLFHPEIEIPRSREWTLSSVQWLALDGSISYPTWMFYPFDGWLGFYTGRMTEIKAAVRVVDCELGSIVTLEFLVKSANPGPARAGSCGNPGQYDLEARGFVIGVRNL